MSRTTLDIDETLLEDAMKAIGAKTKTEAVELALQEAIRHRRRQQLMESLGTYDLDIDLEELRRLRSRE